jgi:hypothetical protein
MYKCALVPLDGSVVAEGIIPFLLEVAGPLDLDMEVALIRVLIPTPPMAIEGTRNVAVDDVDRQRTAAQEYLATITAGLRAKGVRVTTHVRRGETVAKTSPASAMPART